MKLSLIVTSFQDGSPDCPISITLYEQGATIGRRENNSLVLPDPKRFISGCHAIIDYQALDYFITDTSTNGVLINQSPTPLGNGNRAKLNDGDLLVIGDYTLIVKIDDVVGITEENEPSLDYAKPFPTGPLADVADENLDFSTDPFGELDTDPVQKMIEENELIPSEWHDDQEPVADPFAFHGQEFNGTDSVAGDTPQVKDYNKGYLPPEEAIQEAFDDILAHQYSVIAGMQTALLAVLQRFDPERLEQRLQQESPISASIPFHR